MSFWHDYLATQFDPAHLLSELGFSIVFELAQLAVIARLWKRAHARFDRTHGLEHDR